MGKNACEGWTEHDDAILKYMISLHGTSWSKMSDALPTRSVASMRNRYARLRGAPTKRRYKVKQPKPPLFVEAVPAAEAPPLPSPPKRALAADPLHDMILNLNDDDVESIASELVDDWIENYF